MSKLAFRSNISTFLSNCKNWFCLGKLILLGKVTKQETLMRGEESSNLHKIFRKILKYFSTFEYADILSNLEENCHVNSRDSSKKQMHGTRNKNKHFMILPFLL